MTKFKFSLLLSYVSYRESKDQPNQPNSSGSPNPDPISDQKVLFSAPVFRSGDGYKTQHYMFT